MSSATIFLVLQTHLHVCLTLLSDHKAAHWALSRSQGAFSTAPACLTPTVSQGQAAFFFFKDGFVTAQISQTFEDSPKSQDLKLPSETKQSSYLAISHTEPFLLV